MKSEISMTYWIKYVELLKKIYKTEDTINEIKVKDLKGNKFLHSIWSGKTSLTVDYSKLCIL